MQSSTESLIAGGAVAVVVGAYLPWLRTNPNLGPDAAIPTIHYTGMRAGFEVFDFALLGAVALAVLLRGVGFRAPIRVLIGVGVAVFPVHYLSSATSIGFSATFVPASGWYLTLLGGVLLTVAGVLQLPSLIRRVGATTRAS